MGKIYPTQTVNELYQLERLIQSKIPPLSGRASIIKDVLLGMKEKDVAIKYILNNKTPNKWLNRYLYHGLEGLNDMPRVGRNNNGPTVEDIEYLILNEQPPNGAINWSIRSLAKELNTDRNKIYRIIKKYKIPLSRQDLKMKLRTLENLSISGIKGAFICPCVQAAIFQMEIQEQKNSNIVQKSNHKKIENNVPFMATERYNKINIELIESIKRILPDISALKIKKSDNSDFLLFLCNIDGIIDKDKEVLLLMSSLAVDIDNRISRWLDQHRRFQVHSWATSDGWLDLFNKRIETIEDKFKKPIIFHMDHLLADLAIYDIKFKNRQRPFISYIIPR
jgi:hypothetical protein